ncbi:MAG: hypothetical protein C4527_00385 [Candidatus Omnitrophota bacterium]|jgi:hypothetical protein|nr:MAG: hypothetical protein C4527_00385 [Candidatus Omnitrophota bacterium]
MAKFWKRLFTDKEEEPSPPNEQELKGKPEIILLWIDPDHPDLPARVIRAFAYVEALLKETGAQIRLACANAGDLLNSIKRNGIEWIDLSGGEIPLSFGDFVAQETPDLTIADLCKAPSANRLREINSHTMLVLLGSSFEESLFGADAVLLPGVIAPPAFETVSFPPSRLGKCIHGEEFISLPDCYFDEKTDLQEIGLKPCLAVTESISLEDSLAIANQLQTACNEEVVILADVRELKYRQFKESMPVNEIIAGSVTLGERLQALNRSRFVVTHFSLLVYEFMSQGKPLILLPRTEAETAVCRLLRERGAAMVCDGGKNRDGDELRNCLITLWGDESLQKKLGETARRIVAGEGARRTIVELMARWKAVPDGMERRRSRKCGRSGGDT